MRATLHFDLPDDSYEFRAAVEGIRSLAALHEIRELIRSHLKYGNPEDSTAKIEEIRELVYDSLLWVAE